MASQKFILDLPTGNEFSIEAFVTMVNKKLKSEYSVRSKEPDQRDFIPSAIQQLNKRITGIEDYLNDWTESQLRTNKVTVDQFAILGHKVTELDQWANTVIEDTNRIIQEINAHDPEGTRKYIFGVLDNVVKEINDQRDVLNRLLDFVSSDSIDHMAKRAIQNIGQIEEDLKKQLQPQKRGRGRPKKTDSPSIKLTKKDIENAKEELAKLEASQQPQQQLQKRGRGRPRKDQQVTKPATVNNQKKKRGRPKKTETR